VPTRTLCSLQDRVQIKVVCDGSYLLRYFELCSTQAGPPLRGTPPVAC